MVWLLYRLARVIRHAPGIRKAEWLWNFVRPVYHRTLQTVGLGIPVRYGQVTVRLPGEFSGLGWEGYEVEANTAYADWIRKNPVCQVLDVGSSVGLMSLIALFASDEAEVLAFDADLTSLAVLKRLCRYAPRPDRVRRIVGLLSTNPTSSTDLATAEASTSLALAARSGSRPHLRDTRYICLDGANEKELPVYSLDRLLIGHRTDRSILLKIDVEGAELLVLRGADRVVREGSPTILVSVHRTMTGQFGYTQEDVRAWLTERGYAVKILAVDHEEHWWCTHESAVGNS
jgi:FkbM family methyltransferase